MKSVDSDEVAHDESPHPSLHCLPFNALIFNMTDLGQNSFQDFEDNKSAF